LIWAIVILVSASTEWCFTAKTNDPKYEETHPEDVKIACPYIRPSLIDAMSKGEEI